MFGIRLIRHGGLGDVAMALCTAKSLKDQGLYVEFFTNPIYASLAKACPYVDKVISDPLEQRALLNTPQHNKINILNKDLGSAWYGTCGIHEVDAFLYELKIYTENINKTLTINIPSHIEEKINKLLIDNKCYLNTYPRIILHPGISDPHRTWPLEYWNELVELLHKQYTNLRILVIGASSADNKDVQKLSNPNVIDLTNQLSFLETIQLMRECDQLISCDSGPIQLAGATDIDIIGLYSVVAGENRLPYRNGSIHHKTRIIKPLCNNYPCFLQLHNPIHWKELRAMKSGGVDFHNTLVNWCLNSKSKFSCMQEITPQQICDISIGIYDKSYS